MSKVKHAVASKQRRKKVLKAAKGYVGGRSRLFRTAKETVMRALAYSYRDRKVKKRDFRSLWITRINIACRNNGITYARFINGLKRANIILDRKMLSNLAVYNKTVFNELIALVSGKKAA